METREDILDYLKANREFFTKQFHIVKIGLFGSFARSEQTPQSGIDLIIELDAPDTDVYLLKKIESVILSHRVSTGGLILPERNICALMRGRRYFRRLFLSDAKDRLSLKGILDAAEKIVDFSRPFSNADDFFADQKSFDAVCMNLIILGEMVDLFFNFRHKFIPCRQI